MLDGAIDRNSHVATTDQLPYRLVQKTSRASTIVQLLLVMPALFALVVPITLCVQAAMDQHILAIISDRPIAAVQIAIAVTIWSLIFGAPLVTVSKRIGSSRVIEIDADDVRVIDRSLLGSRQWTAPVSSYRGIAHHVKTTLSGLQHELVLIHADPKKNVLVALADRLPQTALDQAKMLLQLPELPAAALYDRPRSATRRIHGTAELRTAETAMG